MSSSDRERLAPVTHLFGAATPAPRAESVSPSEKLRPERLPEVEPRVETEPGFEADPPRQPKLAARGEGKFERISNVSMYALARRGMSSREMRDYLSTREFDADEIEIEVARLEGVALIDDGALAETLVRTLRDRKGLGRGALTAELRRRNLDSTAIEAAMESAGDDELLRATEIAVKRAPQLRGLDSQTAKRRLGAFLMRKGYNGSVVQAAVAAALTPSGPVFR